uniref:Uncharacterized protein n=1 Tax=Opuntia streptacantha TaxID=393608 RepID=A0A7C9E9P0_OPUST
MVGILCTLIMSNFCGCFMHRVLLIAVAFGNFIFRGFYVHLIVMCFAHNYRSHFLLHLLYLFNELICNMGIFCCLFGHIFDYFNGRLELATLWKMISHFICNFCDALRHLFNHFHHRLRRLHHRVHLIFDSQ